MDVLDGVLDRDHVGSAPIVDLAQHGGQRGRLAAAGGAGHDDQALVQVGDLLEDGGQAQPGKGRDLVGDHAEHRSATPIVVQGVDPKTRNTRQVMREVHVSPADEGIILLLIEEGQDHLVHHLAGQRVDIQEADIALDAQGGSAAHLQVQVRSPHLDRLPKELFQGDHRVKPSSGIPPAWRSPACRGPGPGPRWARPTLR